MSEKHNIYFDNAATTTPLFLNQTARFYNPSSPHGLGIRSERALNAARAEIAGYLGCQPSEIIFTSGGTEANNLAVIGFALANKRKNIKIYAAPWEHPSVIEPIKFLIETKTAEAEIAPFTARDISPGTGLVCVSQVSNETGDIFNFKKEHPDTVVFMDGVQGFCKEKTDLTNIDMYSFSGHKIHGAYGFGGLYVKNGIKIAPVLFGGGQERGFRAGTENVPGAAQTAAAIKTLCDSREKHYVHVSSIKAKLLEIKNELPRCFENSIGHHVSPYILNISFLGIKGETLVHLLSEKGIYASMGAACRSRKKQKSALELMGFDLERAQSAVRFSFSHMNTVEEAETAKEIIINQVSQMRRVLGGR